MKVYEKLLVAAHMLESRGQTPFSAEDLVVEAWKQSPETFGLAGYVSEEGVPIYPNSNRVFAEIMGSKPIRKQGWLTKVGTKRFRLTESGRLNAIALSESANGVVDQTQTSFTREAALTLRKMLGARAVDKYLRGDVDAITFHDAASFWGITPRSTAMDFEGRRGEIEGTLAVAEAITQRAPVSLEHGGRKIAVEDVRRLVDLHQLLMANFDSQITVIRRRTDERA